MGNSTDRYIIGVDPGLAGAIAVLTESGEFTHGIAMPSGGGRILVSEVVGYLSPWIEEGSLMIVAIEKVHAHPGQGVSSTFTFGRALGAIEGAIEALRLPQVSVPPNWWKQQLSLPKADKDGARQFATRRWPGVDHWERKAKGQAMADAACIALAWLERKK